jgi:aspartyl/asparaginyl beta-hydroxylase (cupin superfamily)
MSNFLPRAFRKGLTVSVGKMESLNKRFSLVGNQAILDTTLFPWIASIESEWRSVRAELDEVLKFRDGLPNFQDISIEQKAITDDDRWKTFFFYGYGARNDLNCQICPATSRVLERIPGMKTAFFSILFPGKHIPRHRGPYNGVLRYHLGLMVPEPENCRLVVGGIETRWQEGKSIVFDDSFQHEAWNDSDKMRVVLFVDFLRPLWGPAAQLNGAFIRAAGMSDFIQAGLKRQAKWNHTFAELYNRNRG